MGLNFQMLFNISLMLYDCMTEKKIHGIKKKKIHGIKILVGLISYYFYTGFCSPTKRIWELLFCNLLMYSKFHFLFEVGLERGFTST